MGLLTVKYETEKPVVGAKVYIRDSSTNLETMAGITDRNGQLIISAPPFWYTRGTLSMVVDAGNVRVGTFWGYVLGFMTPDFLTVHIKQSTQPPVQGEIEYPVLKAGDEMTAWVIFVLIVAAVFATGFVIAEAVVNWLRNKRFD